MVIDVAPAAAVPEKQASSVAAVIVMASEMVPYSDMKSVLALLVAKQALRAKVGADVGDAVGTVVGVAVGAVVGTYVTGTVVGAAVGAVVGTYVTPIFVGVLVGAVVGDVDAAVGAVPFVGRRQTVKPWSWMLRSECHLMAALAGSARLFGPFRPEYRELPIWR
jgi:hypothetical protein